MTTRRFFVDQMKGVLIRVPNDANKFSQKITILEYQSKAGQNYMFTHTTPLFQCKDRLEATMFFSSVLDEHAH